ncbi:MAG: SLBB domain-containing protein [Spirochaetaceae bacterium]|jgi:Na+-translocating ferredoxin:NAD+ oxidoreductase RnfC subunit|nr:SLBB domain-containing protein [Spirochaetaceae bacterium]
MNLSQLVLDAGVVGCGGAGFPAHVKYAKPAELLLMNGAECEPLLRTDQYIMAAFAERLCAAALAVQSHLGAKRLIFVLKEHYHEQIKALKAASATVGADIELCLLDSVYPAGDEQVLLYEAAGLTVPPGGIPMQAGAVISNAGTLLAVADALEGKPVTHRYLTVTGEVLRPGVFRVPVGLGFEECIALAGGAKIPDYFTITGGPVMGRVNDPAAAEAPVVTKTTNGIILLPGDHYLRRRNEISPAHMKNRARSACIQCTLCSASCPRTLLGSPLRPHLVMRAFASARTMDELVEIQAAQNALLCCECGICEIYACPMELQPCRINVLLKGELRRRGIPFQPSPANAVSIDRPYRRIPTKRMASRAGVLPYYDIPAGEFRDVPSCARVAIPLRMHAGLPSAPCVSPGQRVRQGELIADIPPGALGAKIHASIDGVVREAGDRVVIEAEGKTG